MNLIDIIQNKVKGTVNQCTCSLFYINSNMLKCSTLFKFITNRHLMTFDDI